MIALIQRVSTAHVDVDDETVGAIGPGLLALVAVQPDDGEAQARRLLERMLGYRVFADAAGKMNRSLADTGGGL
ncbi:MAG: D-tyrosyl-tRNA(Tyr) deacylase, partial [Rhodanobacter sp.]